MARVFAVAVGLSAILFVAFAFPQPQEQESTATTEASGTTADPCAQYKEQCGNQTAQSNSNQQCDYMYQSCQQQNGNGMTQPTGGPSSQAPPVTPPPGGMAPPNGNMTGGYSPPPGGEGLTAPPNNGSYGMPTGMPIGR